MLFLSYVLMTLHMLFGIILIGIILLQRGRGGGLAGAFGGMGGQSAFGTKAGDIFTRITIVLATIWILLACVCILVANSATRGRFKAGTSEPVIKAPANEKDLNEAKPTAEGKPPISDGATSAETRDASSEKKNEEAETKKSSEAESKAAPEKSEAPAKDSSDSEPKSEKSDSPAKADEKKPE